MEKTSAAPTTTHSTSSGTDSKTTFEQTMYQRNLFMVMALNMTWQLAVVVLVPIVGGFKLDEHFDSSPWLTLIGVVIASAGMALVLRRVTRQAAVRVAKGPKT